MKAQYTCPIKLENNTNGLHGNVMWGGGVHKIPPLDEELQASNWRPRREGETIFSKDKPPNGYPTANDQP